MSTYQYYREPCALCGDYFPSRDLTKLYLGKSHCSSPVPRKLCGVCDNCFPKLLDFLEVSEPEEPERKPYKPRQWCRKCVRDVGKNARFCPHCGDELASQRKDKIDPPVVAVLPESALHGDVVMLEY